MHIDDYNQYILHAGTTNLGYENTDWYNGIRAFTSGDTSSNRRVVIEPPYYYGSSAGPSMSVDWSTQMYHDYIYDQDSSIGCKINHDNDRAQSNRKNHFKKSVNKVRRHSIKYNSSELDKFIQEINTRK